jgi:hypothetical protein
MEKRSVCVWSCGTWCHEEDLESYGWMSDDYRCIDVGDDTTDDEIECIVRDTAK